MEKTTVSTTRRMVECAVLLAIAAALSIFPKFSGLWANGGSVTLCSMLPIILAGYRHGTKWGLATGFAFALLQMLQGLYLPAGGILAAGAGLALDYILPFTLIGLGGIFKGKLKAGAGAELAIGTALVMVLRYICHVLSGVVLWGSLVYAQGFFGGLGGFGQNVLATVSGNALFWVYSAIYNAGYMLPELVITVCGAFAISKLSLYGLPKQS